MMALKQEKKNNNLAIFVGCITTQLIYSSINRIYINRIRQLKFSQQSI